MAKTILITAGPTREKIDPVRYITNHSSGKMGYAIAEEAAKDRGKCHFNFRSCITNTTTWSRSRSGLKVHDEMYDAVLSRFAEADIVIKSAAVADYRPKTYHDHKIKKQPGEQVIELERTKDILHELGKEKRTSTLIGFAAETDHVDEYAIKNLTSKNADMIVANNIARRWSRFWD